MSAALEERLPALMMRSREYVSRNASELARDLDLPSSEWKTLGALLRERDGDGSVVRLQKERFVLRAAAGTLAVARTRVEYRSAGMNTFRECGRCRAAFLQRRWSCGRNVRMFTPSSLFGAGILICCMASAPAAVPAVYPRPQKADISEDYVSVRCVDVQTKAGKAALPEVEGAYKISICGDGRATIVAPTALGVKYAKQTLSQLLRGVKDARSAHRDPFPEQDIAAVAKMGSLPVCEIEDWPDVPYRGIVEGFYGPPGWTNEGRESLIRFLGRNKMNVFIYGPKGDPYHHGQWRKPYPDKEAKELRKLNKLAEQNGVRFVWAIHPGGQINWSSIKAEEADFAAIVRKFEWMYDLGIRNFGVFFDDIRGDDGKPENQVRAMKYIMENFVAKKKDVAPLLFCPSGYNRSWTNEQYLKTIGEGLDKSVMIMWTGDTVVHDISLQGQEWFTARTGRPAFIWWNYPCCDFCRTNLTMGPLYDSLHPQALEKEPKMKELLIGMTSNPMDHSEASKIGLFSIGAYAWNIMGFDSDQAWKESIRRLYPECPEAMQVFCSHNSDLGPNTHGYRKDESVEMQPVVERAVGSVRVGEPDKEALKKLGAEFERMHDAACVMQEKLPKTILRESAPMTPDNPDAYKEYSEIGTWVKAFEYTSAAGRQAVKSVLDEKGSLTAYTRATALLDRYACLNSTYNQTPWQSGVKVCSRVMRPAIDELLTLQGARLYESLGGQKSGSASSNAPVASSTASGFPSLSIDEDNKKIGVSRVMEPHILDKGANIKLSIPSGIHVTWVEINLGCNIRSWAKVTLTLADGRTIPARFEEWKPNVFVMRGKALPDAPIVGMELLNQGDAREVKLEMFKFDVDRGKADSALSLTDGRLETTYRLVPGASVKVACPASARAGVVVTSAAVKVDGASASKASGGKVVFKLQPGAESITLRPVSKEIAVVNEVIFR